MGLDAGGKNDKKLGDFHNLEEWPSGRRQRF
jgi:hypothetical protein